jgi:hypothetical protein
MRRAAQCIAAWAWIVTELAPNQATLAFAADTVFVSSVFFLKYSRLDARAAWRLRRCKLRLAFWFIVVPPCDTLLNRLQASINTTIEQQSPNARPGLLPCAVYLYVPPK